MSSCRAASGSRRRRLFKLSAPLMRCARAGLFALTVRRFSLNPLIRGQQDRSHQQKPKSPTAASSRGRLIGQGQLSLASARRTRTRVISDRRVTSQSGQSRPTSWTRAMVWGIIAWSGRETIMDVGDWLRSLGLGQYETAFRENEIDGDVLPMLTAEDLKELGVVILGHRRKMLTAITELSGSTAVSPTSARPPPAKSPAPSSMDAAERRQLTVMFCDLVGSTAMSARLDPEDMREVIRAYQDACSGAVARYDGFVAKFMGDGVLAYFGFPRAHEDDAERAVRAGLDILTATAKLDTHAKETLMVRIGVAPGIVVVGDLVGQGL